MPTSRRPLRVHAIATFLYAAVAILFSWPLPLHIADRLLGSVAGDLGTYVWNLWVFRHELIVHHRFPLFTHEVLGLTPSVDLSLHNYTLFADLLALPLLSFFSIITTFNLIYLSMSVLTAWAMFLLARSLTGRTVESWLAGLMFGFSSIFVARSVAHSSLAAAAPLPLFMWAVHRGCRTGDRRFAVLAGATAAWASMWDVYYGVFCVLAAAVYIAATWVRFEGAAPRSDAGRTLRWLDLTIVILLLVVAVIAWTGGTEFQWLGQRVLLRSLYSPVLALTILVPVRAYMAYRPVLIVTLPPLRGAVETALAAGIACGVVLLPILYAFGYSLADGASVHGPIYWRSSPPGADLLALFVPNPNHPLFGEWWRRWLDAQTNGFPENAASLSLVGCVVVGIACWRYRFRPHRTWTALTIFFGLLTLGPFVHIGGVNTFIPGPWALLRYLPVITATRTPTRYAIPLSMAFAVLFAMALARIAARHERIRRPILVGVGLLLVFELSPFPRTLYSAHVPDVYRIIAADPRDIRVLQLPFGFRSGEWSEGNFSAATLFYQTSHEKGLLGGYLSRISQREVARQRKSYHVSRLVDLSAGGPMNPARIEYAAQRAAGFVERSRIGYVVMNTAAVPEGLRRWAMAVFKLNKIAESEGFELFVPTVGVARADPVEAQVPSPELH